MYSIGIGRTHTGTRVILLAQDLDIRIIDAATGELLRELASTPSKRLPAHRRPPGPPAKRQEPNPRIGFGCPRMS